MASVDIINAIFKAYEILWRERFYLVRLGAVPLLIIFFNLLFIQGLDDQTTMLRRGLFLLPGMFAEAWFIAQVMRTLLTGERWPMPPIDPARPVPSAAANRVRGLLAAILIYVLCNLLLNMLAALFSDLRSSGLLEDNMERPNAAVGLGSLALLIGMLWGFRLLWLYLPAVVNISLVQFLKSLGGWMASVHMLGLWLACVLPIIFAAMLVDSVLHAFVLLGAPEGLYAFFVTVLNVAAQTLWALVSSTAMAILLRPLLVKHGPPV